MSRFKFLPILAGAAALMLGAGLAAPASADVFDITSCHITGGCPSGGTITTTDISGGVEVAVTLAGGEIFANTGAGANQAVLFDLTGTPNLTITTISANLTPLTLANGGVANNSLMADGAGTFEYGVNCSSTTPTPCGSGTSAPELTSPITFDLFGSGLTSASFTTNGSGNFFAVDVGIPCGGTGQPTCNGTSNFNTGAVDASTRVVPAPLVGHGLLVLLAIGGVLSGGKLLENLKKRQLHTA